MANLDEISMAKNLTPALACDPRMVRVMEAVDKELKELAARQYLLYIVANIDVMPEPVINLLAWQWHVDFWDDSLELDQKRKLVKNSIAWHRRKGTPAVVEEVVGTILEKAVIKENWEYGGNPYCFRVEMIEGPLPNAATIDRLVKAINSVKNKRSHLDGVAFFREINCSLFLGSSTYIHKTVTINPVTFKMPDVSGKKYLGGIVNVHKKVKI